MSTAGDAAALRRFALAAACAALAAASGCNGPREPNSKAPLVSGSAPTASAASGAEAASGGSSDGASCALPPPRVGPAGHRSAAGGELAPCGRGGLVTGFHRDDYCRTSEDDTGVHVVCAEVTDAFLSFSRARGNDLVTPRGGFRGLRAGDRWCLCAARWAEAEAEGVAPPVVLGATDESATRHVPRAALEARALGR